MSKVAAPRIARNLTRQRVLADSVVLAATHWTRAIGLLGTPSNAFPRGSGLWIIPSRGVHTLGMQYAIDVLYLNAELGVVDLLHHLPPWRIAPIRWGARSVLELPAGTLAESGTAIGDLIGMEPADWTRQTASAP